MKQFGFFKAFLVLLIFMLINIIISFSLQIMLQFQMISFYSFKLLLSLTFLIPTFIVYYIYKSYIHFSIKISNNFLLYTILIILAFSLQIIGTIIEVWSISIIPENYQNYYNLLKEMLLPKNDFDAFISLITIGIIAPFCEEFLFRGIILDNLYKKYPPITANLFQAILFGIAHMNPFQFLYAIPIGYLLGWFYIKTKNLWIPICIHIFTNSLAIILSFIEIDQPFWKKMFHFGEDAKSIYDLPFGTNLFFFFCINYIYFTYTKINKKKC
ncbi:MAG: hypothetical protein KatS3mg129_0079 [Leptospiraceae bacterium]|nr:MAG: hypothetical protein KatS3mg129_0079 [Leptospiraceae bacterium]